MENLKLYAITYNVGTSTPDQNLSDLLSSHNLKHEKSLPDFYVISLQEVSAQPQNLLLSVFYDDPWTQACRYILEEKDYVKLKTIRLQGLLLSVYSLRKHLLNIREMESEYTRTGLSGMWGNKGAVSIRLSIYGCSFCFVNCHLSAHENMMKDRIQDYNSIISDQHFHVVEHDKILYHDYVFWMGDLNFRLLESFNKSPEEIERCIEKGDLETLLKNDELRYLMKSSQIFSDFKEETPTFPPTFKYQVETSQYDHKRKPAWTDRILYKVGANNYQNVTLKADPISYKALTQYTLSDHKPVIADFVVKIPQITQMDSNKGRAGQVFAGFAEEVVLFKKIPFWYADDENTITYTITKEIQKTKEDWIGIYKNKFGSIDDYLSYEYVNKGSSPASIPRDASHSKDVVRPMEYTITFSESAAKLTGELYQLVYISEEDKVQSILGVSEPFTLREKPKN